MTEILGILGTAILPELLLKGAVVLAAAAVLTWSLRGASAATRHGVWVVALSVLVMLPLGIRVAPHWGLPTVGAATTGAPSVQPGAMNAETGAVPEAPAPVEAAATPAVGEEAQPAKALQHGYVAALSIGEAAAAPPPAIDWGRRLGAFGFGIWALGFVLLLFRSLRDVFRIRMITRFGSGEVSEPLVRAAAEVGTALRLRRRLRIRSSDWTEVPVTWGVRRPVILVPRGAEQWDAGLLRAALMHEAAHIRRLDYAWHFLCEAATAFHWPNPVVWWARQRVRVEQERACDDVVIREGIRATDYAAQLVSIARHMSGPALNATTAMARGPRIGARLEDILNRTLDRSPLSHSKMLGRASVLMAVAALTAGATVHDRPNAPSSLADIFSLAVNRSPDAMDALLSQTESPVAEVRGVAALSLGERGDPSAIPILVNMLADPDPWVRENAAVSLTRLRGPGRAEAVGRLLADSAESVRSVASWALGQIGGQVSAELLTRVLAEDPDDHTRHMAAAAVTRIDDADVVPGILDRMDGLTDDKLDPIIFALGQLTDPRSSEVLRSLVETHADPEIRHAALHAISPDDPNRIDVWIRAAREDEAWRVRNMAVVRLGEEDHPRALEAVMQALRDPVHQVRLNAAWALEGRGRQADSR